MNMIAIKCKVFDRIARKCHGQRIYFFVIDIIPMVPYATKSFQIQIYKIINETANISQIGVRENKLYRIYLQKEVFCLGIYS